MVKQFASVLTVVAVAGSLASASADVGSTASFYGKLDPRVAGTPVRSATVTVRDGQGTSTTVKADAKGRFAAVGLAPGHIEVYVSMPGFMGYRSGCKLAAGESGYADLPYAKVLPGISHMMLREIPCRVGAGTQDSNTIPTSGGN